MTNSEIEMVSIARHLKVAARGLNRPKTVSFKEPQEQVKAYWKADGFHLYVQSDDTKLFLSRETGLRKNTEDLVPLAPRFDKLRVPTSTRTTVPATEYPVNAYDQRMYGWNASNVTGAWFTRYPKAGKPIDVLALLLYVIHPNRLM